MVTSIARQSVIIKCNMQASSILGNYEFYYAAGLFCRIKGISAEEDIQPESLKNKILPELNHFSSEDPREQYLAGILLNCEPAEEYDDQMKELFLWGLKEDHIWKVH